MVDHSSNGQRTSVPAQEGDVMTAGQAYQAAFGVFLGFLEEGSFFEHVMEVQVEQSDACWTSTTQEKQSSRTTKCLSLTISCGSLCKIELRQGMNDKTDI